MTTSSVHATTVTMEISSDHMTTSITTANNITTGIGDPSLVGEDRNKRKRLPISAIVAPTLVVIIVVMCCLMIVSGSCWHFVIKRRRAKVSLQKSQSSELAILQRLRVV